MVDTFAMLGVHDRAAKLGHCEVLRRIERYTQRFRCHVCHPCEFGRSFGSLAAALALGTACVVEARAVVETAADLLAVDPLPSPHAAPVSTTAGAAALRPVLEELNDVLETVRLVEDGRHHWLTGFLPKEFLSPSPA
jgi:hypothetical protein